MDQVSDTNCKEYGIVGKLVTPPDYKSGIRLDIIRSSRIDTTILMIFVSKPTAI